MAAILVAALGSCGGTTNIRCSAHCDRDGALYEFRAYFFARHLPAIHSPRLGCCCAFRHGRGFCHLCKGTPRAQLEPPASRQRTPRTCNHRSLRLRSPSHLHRPHSDGIWYCAYGQHLGYRRFYCCRSHFCLAHWQRGEDHARTVSRCISNVPSADEKTYTVGVVNRLLMTLQSRYS